MCGPLATTTDSRFSECNYAKCAFEKFSSSPQTCPVDMSLQNPYGLIMHNASIAHKTLIMKQWFFSMFVKKWILNGSQITINQKTGLLLRQRKYLCKYNFGHMSDYELTCNGYKSISFGFQMFNAEAILFCLCKYTVKRGPQVSLVWCWSNYSTVSLHWLKKCWS